MPDSEAKKNWMKENSIIFTMRIMRRTEPDLVAFIEERNGESKAALFKKALRYYIAHIDEIEGSDDDETEH